MPSNAKAATLTGAQLRHLLRVTAATSRAPERDRLVLLLGMTMFSRNTYAAAVADLRGLLREIGRAEFRAYGYVPQLRQYRAAMREAA